MMARSDAIQMARTRLKEDKIKCRDVLSMQAFVIESKIKRIPNGAALVGLIAAKLLDMVRIQSQGHEIVLLLDELTEHVVRSGGGMVRSSTEFLDTIRPLHIMYVDLKGNARAERQAAMIEAEKQHVLNQANDDQDSHGTTGAEETEEVQGSCVNQSDKDFVEGNADSRQRKSRRWLTPTRLFSSSRKDSR
ncbi:hypothetical protein BGZ47_006325 [Haplosporangium gracile]|nr:hypothetical protein BGZ47_006325 [Haplosporangium gracile]